MSYNGNRREEVMLCRIRLGHTELNSSWKLIGKHGTGMCNGCMVEEMEHIIL